MLTFECISLVDLFYCYCLNIILWYESIISIIAPQLLLVNANFDYNRRSSSTRPRYWIFFRHIWFPRGCTDICNNCRKYWKVHDSKLNFLFLTNDLPENDCVKIILRNVSDEFWYSNPNFYILAWLPAWMLPDQNFKIEWTPSNR